MQTNTPFKDLIFGNHPVLEALESGKEINKILVLRGAVSEHTKHILQLASQRRIPVQKVPVEKLNRVTRKNHQGVIAFLSPVSYHRIEDVIPNLYEEGKTPLVVVLDHITDVRNVGAICRSAECMGAQAILLPTKGAGALNADAAKASAGAIFNLHICRTDHLEGAIRYLKDSGLSVVSCTEKGSETLYKGELSGPTCIILGAEDTGIQPALLALSDQHLRIPMAGQTGSLNVSVSAGIILAECLKQRSDVENTLA